MIIALSFVSATVAANAQTEAKAITMEQTAPIATYGKANVEKVSPTSTIKGKNGGNVSGGILIWWKPADAKKVEIKAVPNVARTH